MNAKQHGCIAGDPTDSQVKRQMVKSENLKPWGSYRRPEISTRMEELAAAGGGGQGRLFVLGSVFLLLGKRRVYFPLPFTPAAVKQ